MTDLIGFLCVAAAVPWIGLLCLLIMHAAEDDRPYSPHEDVDLTPDGADVWRQVSDPESPAGKPIHHKPRRLEDG